MFSKFDEAFFSNSDDKLTKFKKEAEKDEYYFWSSRGLSENDIKVIRDIEQKELALIQDRKGLYESYSSRHSLVMSGIVEIEHVMADILEYRINFMFEPLTKVDCRIWRFDEDLMCYSGEIDFKERTSFKENLSIMLNSHFRDRSGKFIYEGDLVKTCNICGIVMATLVSKDRLSYKVSYNIVHRNYKSPISLDSVSREDVEVYGNMFEGRV